MCAVREYNTDPVGQVTMRKDHGLKHIQVNVRAYDPTHTTVLRNRMVSVSNKKFNEFARLISVSVGTNDIFSLKTQVYAEPLKKGAFDFLTNPQKIEEFIKWLREQAETGILTLNDFGDRWTDAFILDSYGRGVARARLEMKLAGYTLPTIDQSGGINFVMGEPLHANRVSLLFTRTFEELRGITDTMAQQISRVLSQGLIDGDYPIALARKLVAVIKGSGEDLGITDTLGRFIPAKRRAEILARTEIIRAHHLATIQEYRRWGVDGAHVMAEFSTAKDTKVCPICEGIEAEGKLYTLDEIEGMIPQHPQCRCIALPRVINAINPFR